MEKVGKVPKSMGKYEERKYEEVQGSIFASPKRPEKAGKGWKSQEKSMSSF